MKKHILILFGSLLLLFSASSCRQHDYRTLVIHVPEMRNQACVREISKSLARSPGLTSNSVKFDMANRQITVTYDSLVTADKNLEFLVVKAGFEANGIPADKKAAAALPPDCRR